jgi:hypothetical protein
LALKTGYSVQYESLESFYLDLYEPAICMSSTT